LEFRLGGPQLYRIKEVEPWSRIPERRYALIPLSQ
jgi:DNA polymerase-4/protein ImuB